MTLNRGFGSTARTMGSIGTSLLLTIMGLVAIAPSAHAATKVTGCSFSQDGGTTYQQHLDVAISGAGSASILTQVTDTGSSLVKQSFGFVLKTDKFGAFVDAGNPFGTQYPADQGDGAYPMFAPTTITGNDANPYWLTDMTYMFFTWAVAPITPKTHYFEYRYYNADAPYNLMCSIIVDYTPAATAVNYGHSDKTASSSDRNRLYFSTDPSGQKPKK